jgi:hypothetical protein
MSTEFFIPDGLTELRDDLPLVVRMIARSARWVHPDTFRSLPVWCPDTARGRPRYDARWLQPLVSGRGVPKLEENIRAANALVSALGVRAPKPKNWTVCHIWGYDDDKFAAQSNIVKDPRYYSCVGNMVWLPTPLKGFTDAVPKIKRMMRTCAFHMYGWVCEHPDAAAEAELIKQGVVPDEYPDTWPSGTRRVLPNGTAPLSGCVVVAIEKKKREFRRLLEDGALVHYPREEVGDVLRFWRVEL